MSTGSGNNVSKANVYSVLGKIEGENVSKANVYALVNNPLGCNVSKANVYVVLMAQPRLPQIQMFIC